MIHIRGGSREVVYPHDKCWLGLAVSSSQCPIQSDYKTMGAGPEITNPMGAGPEITNPWMQDLRLQIHGCRA